MTAEPLTNGRVTQRDLYDAITRVDTKLDRHYVTLDKRLRDVERYAITERAHDDERELVLKEQREIRTEQGVGRRWLIGLVFANVTAISIGLIGLLR